MPPVDCSVETATYETENIANFTPTTTGWYHYADNTPGGIPVIAVPDGGPMMDPVGYDLPAPGRCGDTRIARLRASGHNFYGVGYGDYAHNGNGMEANGTGFDGISFWARAEGNSERTFLFNVEEGRTIKLPIPLPPEGGLPPAVVNGVAVHQDLDGDGFVGPGDIAGGTSCRIPPPQELGQPACYAGGEEPPATPTRVPEPDECGNQFHTYITTTREWQFFLIPWRELKQWPCPNRVEDGINIADIRGFEIKFIQGSTYEIWLDNIAFYRLRADGGS